MVGEGSSVEGFTGPFVVVVVVEEEEGFFLDSSRSSFLR